MAATEAELTPSSSSAQVPPLHRSRRIYERTPPSPSALTHQRMLCWSARAAYAVAALRWVIGPMLVYHLFVHLYIGASTGDHTDLLQGFMYFSNYAGTAVAFWIVLRLVGSSGRKRRATRVLGCPSDHMQLFDEIAAQCHRRSIATEKRMRRFCVKWEARTLALAAAWTIYSLRNGVLLAQGRIVGDALTESVWGGYGYYNITGQFVAAACILPVATLFVTGFYQLKVLTEGLHENLLECRKALPEGEGEEVEDRFGGRRLYESREHAIADYLFLQNAYADYSAVWSASIVAAIVLCTQVSVANVVLLYQLTEGFSTLPESCDGCFGWAHTVVWLVAALAIIAIKLITLSQINLVASRTPEIFRRSDVDDFRRIGGRAVWLEYLETNPLRLSIAGAVITPSFVMNTIYPASIAFSSLLFSALLGGGGGGGGGEGEVGGGGEG